MQIAFATVYQGQRPSLPDSIPKQLKGLIKACWDSVPAKRPSWEKVLDSLSQMQESLVERGAWGRDARDGSVRPPRLRAGRSLRPPPTPDAPITIGGGSNATPTPVRPEGTRLQVPNVSRRPGSGGGGCESSCQPRHNRPDWNPFKLTNSFASLPRDRTAIAISCSFGCACVIAVT